MQKKKLMKTSENYNYTKMPKSQYINKKANSDTFWRRKFMQVLEAMHDCELTWAQEHWHIYGISDHETKIIEKEFERQKQWRASREKLSSNYTN